MYVHSIHSILNIYKIQLIAVTQSFSKSPCIHFFLKFKEERNEPLNIPLFKYPFNYIKYAIIEIKNINNT